MPIFKSINIIEENSKIKRSLEDYDEDKENKKVKRKKTKTKPKSIEDYEKEYDELFGSDLDDEWLD